MPAATDTPNNAMFKRFLDASDTGDQELMWTTIDGVFEPDARIRTPVPLHTTGRKR